MFIEVRGLLISPGQSEMLGISLCPETIRVNRLAINISPLCGDEPVLIFNNLSDGLFEAKRLAHVAKATEGPSAPVSSHRTPK
jgi:hypothetical protein